MLHRYGRRHACTGGPAALVMLLAALLLAGCGAPSGTGARHPASASPTATFAALPGPAGQWEAVPGLTGGVPVITPNDPNVVYEVLYDSGPPSTRPPALKRSSDGGATWQMLTIPGGLVQPGKSTSMNTNIGVLSSPTDPHLIFLSVAVPYSGTCPTVPQGASYQTSAEAHSASTLSANFPTSGYGQCGFEYRSTDCGQTWQQIALPAGGELASPMYAQGNRLYSLNEGDSGEQHLVESDDGGMTWLPIDAEFATGEQGSLPFMPTPLGSTVFAATSNVDRSGYVLWRSDDAGATWNQVSHLTSTSISMQVVERSGGATPLLYIALTVPDSSSFNGYTPQFEVSADGGGAWTRVPMVGLPPQSPQTQLSLEGQLADDSILVQNLSTSSGTGRTTLTLYAWRAGQSAWRQVAPNDTSAPQVSIRLLAITGPDASGHQAIWVIQGEGTGAVQRYVLQ